MKIRFRRLLSLALTVVMLCSLLPMTAMAGGDFVEIGNFMCEYVQDEETGQRMIDIAAYAGSTTEIMIPSHLQGVPVRSVQIMGIDALTHLAVSEGVRFVGCLYCEGLQRIDLPGTLKGFWGEENYSLSDVYYGGSCEAWQQLGIEIDATIHFSDGSVLNPDDGFDGPEFQPDDPDDGFDGPEFQPDDPDDEFGPQFRVEGHNTLAELTTEDYLAFSAIAYLDLGTEKTVEQALKDSGDWKADWQKNLGVTYGELCADISGWKIADKKDKGNDNGFTSYTFTNAGGEAVIAYRGSVPFEQWGEYPVDAFCDWVVNDLPMELVNVMGPQYESSLEPYKEAAKERNPSQIAVTGHSLGGAWADVMSVKYGCRGVSFNAVSVLDVLFRDKPEEMARIFRGVDQWNFVDHTNRYDMLAGMYEYYFSSCVKPYVAHKGNITTDQVGLTTAVGTLAGLMIGGFYGIPVGAIVGLVGNSVLCHGLRSLVTLDSQGKVIMTDEAHSFIPESTINCDITATMHTIALGTTGADEIRAPLGFVVARTDYGGDGNDIINTGNYGDTLVGGRNDDDLDGGWGNDVYIHSKGDGIDTIHDAAGNDVLRLVGYENGDGISVYENRNSEYIEVQCGTQTIVQISKKNREYSIGTLDKFKIIIGDKEYDVTDAFDRAAFGLHLYVACPVSVEILDGEGNVVYTVRDGEVGNFYTDYGSFYVFAQENGEYAKVLDVREGYTARIIGLDEGTMDVSYQKPVNGVLTDPVMRTDIPVTKDTTAVFVEGEDGKVNLEMDTDGDGNADESIPLRGQNPFTDVSEDQWYAEPVLWAVDEGITSGTTPTTFSPDGTCTRAQVVTFLWAANGRPEPKSMENPFVDVADDAWYLKPVLWAVENGITTGVSSTEFGPENTCTRAQIVTFLYAAAGKPDVSGESTFSDVSNDAWYLKPILWAAQNDVTGGIGEGLFGPENTCTRAQVVTFLYKVYGS